MIGAGPISTFVFRLLHPLGEQVLMVTLGLVSGPGWLDALADLPAETGSSLFLFRYLNLGQRPQVHFL